jgi:predicted kinase
VTTPAVIGGLPGTGKSTVSLLVAVECAARTAAAMGAGGR